VAFIPPPTQCLEAGEFCFEYVKHGDTPRPNLRFYSNEPGDYIFNVQVQHALINNKYRISWSANFYFWDNLESYFEYENGYKTAVETTHHMLGRDFIQIPDNVVSQYDLINVPIVAVYVRTVD